MGEESLLMKFFKRIGMTRIAWSLRRLYVPVPKDALVLEVGSGGNPYPRTNVLLDAYEETVQRYYIPLVKDRPIVLGFAECLPFKDKSFDFIIASHVFEHTTDVDAFLRELQRVGKAGYLETPDAFFERVNPYRSHRIEVTEDNGILRINKKSSPVPDKEIVWLFENKLKRLKNWSYFLSTNPFEFHVRYYWSEKIDYIIVNPKVSIEWEPPDYQSKQNGSRAPSIRMQIVTIIRFLFSQRTKNRKINIFDFLICPTCGSESIKKVEDRIVCNRCAAVYEIKEEVPLMYLQNREKYRS